MDKQQLQLQHRENPTSPSGEKQVIAEQKLEEVSTNRHWAIRNPPTVCTSVDFKKEYYSIDRGSLFNILEERVLDEKTWRLSKQTLTNTASKVTFMGEISEKFKIKNGPDGVWAITTTVQPGTT